MKEEIIKKLVKRLLFNILEHGNIVNEMYEDKMLDNKNIEDLDLNN